MKLLLAVLALAPFRAVLALALPARGAADRRQARNAQSLLSVKVTTGVTPAISGMLQR